MAKKQLPKIMYWVAVHRRKGSCTLVKSQMDASFFHSVNRFREYCQYLEEGEFAIMDAVITEGLDEDAHVAMFKYDDGEIVATLGGNLYRSV